MVEVALQYVTDITTKEMSFANTINTTIAPNPEFDFARQLAPVALLVGLPNVLVVHPSLGVSTVKELIRGAIINSPAVDPHKSSLTI